MKSESSVVAPTPGMYAEREAGKALMHGSLAVEAVAREVVVLETILLEGVWIPFVV